VVGNGFSPLGKGAMIDSHDFVVRCTSCVTAHQGEAGSKIDAWAWFGNANLWPNLYKIPDGKFQSWFILNPASKKFNSDACAYAARLSEARGLPFAPISPGLFNLARTVLKVQPSTGFLAILMALQRLHPRRMTVVGMDATLPTNPGWDEPHPVKLWKTDGKRAYGHNFVREKQLLAASIKAKRFGPLFWTTDIEWVRLP
jgi:hypothetical protein